MKLHSYKKSEVFMKLNFMRQLGVKLTNKILNTSFQTHQEVQIEWLRGYSFLSKKGQSVY